MKKLILSLALSLFSVIMFAQTTHVKSYTKKNGTHVVAHDRTSKNSTQKDNWSTKGNTNPETGKKGYKKAKK